MRRRMNMFVSAGLLVMSLSGRAQNSFTRDAPGMVEAEDPRVTHDDGLGNLAGLWAFWGSGSLTVRWNVREGRLYRVAVRAGGTAALHPETGESLPRMTCDVDGSAAGRSTWDVKEGRDQPGIYLSEAFRLEPGTHTVRVAFVNDYGRDGNDRNLFVDWVGLGPVERPDDLPALTTVEAALRKQIRAVSPIWRFTRDTQGWRAAKEARVLAANGALRVETAGVDPLIFSPRIAVATETRCWLSLQMKVNRGKQGEVAWIRDGRLGMERRAFTLITDGQWHVYNFDLYGHPGWNGQVTGLALRPSDASGARADIRSLTVSDRPLGPAELRARIFEPEDAVLRAGRNVRLLCALENVGGEFPRGATLRLTMPPGVRLVGGAAVHPLPAFEETVEVAWTVRADRPLRGAAMLQATGRNFTPIKAAAWLDFTPSPKARASVADGRPYVPKPVPAPSDYRVGVYYFPGWKQGAAGGWTPIMPYPERKPVLGWYQEGAPEVADWHIKWAVEHGVTFFAYDWYWDRGGRSLDHALHDGFFKAKYRHIMKFCLLWANHNPPGSASEEDLLAVTRYWLDNYFKRPEHLLVDNKPVVIIFSPDRIRSDMGVVKARTAFEKMRAMCRAEGFDGLFLVGCVWPGREQVQALVDQGYDAATGYNYPDAGATPKDGNRPPYDSAPEGYQRFWETIAGYNLLDYIAVTDPGWDSRPWQGEQALARTGKHPDKFRRMLEHAKVFADAHPVGREKARLALVEAWNEFGEGAAVEPHRAFGFGYLDAIRSVFTNAPAAHPDIIPTDVGLGVPQWLPVRPRVTWEFDRPGDHGGWGAMMGLAEFAVAGGVLRARSENTDPAFLCDVQLDAAKSKQVVIRMKLDRGTHAQIFWATPSAGESESQSVSFETLPDGRFHDYRVNLSANRAWRGRITRLRFDPADVEGSSIAIDRIRLMP